MVIIKPLVVELYHFRIILKTLQSYQTIFFNSYLRRNGPIDVHLKLICTIFEYLANGLRVSKISFGYIAKILTKNFAAETRSFALLILWIPIV